MAALVERSKREIPHFYLQRDVNVESADRRRKKWNVEHPELKATWNEIFVRAAAQALGDVPRMNTSFASGRFQEHEECDVLVVAGEEGRPRTPAHRASGKKNAPRGPATVGTHSFRLGAATPRAGRRSSVVLVKNRFWPCGTRPRPVRRPIENSAD